MAQNLFVNRRLFKMAQQLTLITRTVEKMISTVKKSKRLFVHFCPWCLLLSHSGVEDRSVGRCIFTRRFTAQNRIRKSESAPMPSMPRIPAACEDVQVLSLDRTPCAVDFLGEVGGTPREK